MATHSIIAQLPVELLSTPVPVPGGGGGGQCIVDLAAAIALLGSSCGGGLELRFDGRAQAVDVHHEESTICVTPTPTIPDDGGDDDPSPHQYQQSRPPFVKGPVPPVESPTTSTTSTSVVSTATTTMLAETCDDDTTSATAPATQEYKHIPAVPVPDAGDDGFVTLVRPPPAAPSSSSPAVPVSTTRAFTSTGYPVSPPPVPVPQSQPPPAVQTVPVYAVNPPAPPPAAAPPSSSSCASEYETIDVTKVEGIDHETLGLYLGVLDLDLSDILGRRRSGGGLLGLGDLLGGGGGSKSTVEEAVTHATKKTYRMSCGMELPSYATASSEPAPPTTAPSHQKCLEACVRCAVDNAARSGEPADCVAAAHNPALAEGNCRFWTGLRSREHEHALTPPVGDGAPRGSAHGTWNVANLGGKQFVN